MSITALPARAVQAIGSTQVLTDSASLVKELIDNALDAQATSITVEISHNTLDVIQVRDSGHGIAPVDRPMVCKRHCTSKIKDLDDLAKIGGASLGFRGEALASAAEMSGSLVVTTRILGEITAVSLKVSQSGEIEIEDRVSQAVGTTVRVTDLFKSLPVRRQTALKDSAKQLTKVKRILQTYAFARPSVRLHLKVLKAKNDKGNWIYAPKAKANVSDAAIKIIGTRAADQCHWIVWCSDNPPISSAANAMVSQEVDSSYRLEALMPKADSDFSAISNIGQYIAVDSRPVSCKRGTLKQIAQLFKSYLRSSDCTAVITDPFLCMNLICPPGSYDANVEPAKDDVLFANSSCVLKVVESLFRDRYGDLQSNEKQGAKIKRSTVESRVFDLLLARKPPAAVQPLAPTTQPSSFSSSAANQLLEIPAAGIRDPVGTKLDDGIQIAEANASHSSPQTTLDVEGGLESSRFLPAPAHPLCSNNQPWRHSMYQDADDDELLDAIPASQDDDSGEEEDLGDIAVTNPWTLAKLNAPIRNRSQAGPASDLVANNQQLMTPAKGHDEPYPDLSPPVRFPRPEMIHNLLSPAKSQSSVTTDLSLSDRFPYPIKAWGEAQREADTSPHEASMSLPQGTPLRAIPDISQKHNRKGGPRKQQHSNVDKPFTPPVQDPTRVWFDHLEPWSSRPRRSTQPRRPQEANAVDTPIHPFTSLANDPIDTPPPSSRVNVPQHPGLALTMDYERRKAEANAARRALLRQQAQPHGTTQSQLFATFPEDSSPLIKISPSQSSSSPHQNRYRSAIAALHSPPPSSSTTTSSPPNPNEPSQNHHPSPPPPLLHPTDPRAYLLRRSQNPRIKRTKTSLLPLETLSRAPVDNGSFFLRELGLTMKITLPTLRRRVEKELLVETEYGFLLDLGGKEKGVFENEGEVAREEVEMWEKRVGELVARNV